MSSTQRADDGTATIRTLRSEPAASLLGLGAIITFAAIATHSSAGHTFPSMLAVTELAFATVLPFLGYRLYVSGVQLLPDAVRVINPLATERVGYEDLADVYVGPMGRWPLVVHLRTAEGSVIVAFGLRSSRTSVASALRLERMVAEINARAGLASEAGDA